ncbi:putative cell-surface hemin receptor [Corynebacterium renale]|uniref:HtaA domain-containing protein n=1 Tax=Corynebacterium renale TaxID=1724 RepID=UPI000DA2D8C0|nr:HtaA domain-containing protein [Corynebacterium renale]SQG63555.1 putative cell-surface hemin receptor [Corynebacterium renale]STD00823.1 putative cell-surface hemin receptor [Corynebacterium renale]
MLRTSTAALVATLAVSGLVAPTATAQTPNTVTWNVKESFLHSMTHKAVADGAIYTGPNFLLPIDLRDSYIDDAGNGRIDLDGEIELGAGQTAFGWNTELEYSDLHIRVNGTSAQLIGDYEFNRIQGDNRVLLTFDLDTPIKRGEAFSFTNVKTTATADFARSLNGAVQAGQTLDDGLISLNGTINRAPGLGDGSSDIEDGSSEMKTVGIIGAIVAVIAAIGAGGFALSQLNIPALLAQFGIHI